MTEAERELLRSPLERQADPAIRRLGRRRPLSPERLCCLCGREIPRRVTSCWQCRAEVEELAHEVMWDGTEKSTGRLGGTGEP